ncbi:MAG: hypothetical protein AAF493_07870 [Pseudomonadota bacterium]
MSDSPLEFYRDERGNPRARGRDERLARFFETDLQDSVEIARHLVELLGNERGGEFHGNAHSLSINPLLVTIECHADDGPDRRIERTELRRWVEQWIAFING